MHSVPAARRPTLFAQIALRLALVTAVFALVDVGLVVTDYVGDKQVLAEDFVGQQADRIERAWGRRAAAVPSSAVALSRPVGVSRWAYAVLDPSRRPVMVVRDPGVDFGSSRPDAGTLDWTRRDATAAGIRITGVRRFEDRAGVHWIMVVADESDWRVYLPVIAEELMDHVVLPLVPLMALLLAFNIVVVRRMLAPLSAAAAEVDALDLRRPDARLTEPAASREVAALVATLNRALARVQNAMGVLKGFTADAAHELRTPLSVLQLRIEALPEGEPKRRLHEDVQAMTRLVNQMLDLSRADVLDMEQSCDVDLRAVAQDIVAQTAPLAFAAGHDIRLVDLGPATLRGHPDAIGRALRNLVENAIAHAGGDGPIEVAVGPGARLSVRDHGKGLSVADADMIFRRFWRKDRRGAGAGLGLGIARSIVEAHGGVLTAQNAPSGGAVFACSFPSHVSPPTAPQSPDGARSRIAATP